MKPIWVNKRATINTGPLVETSGLVVAFDSTKDEAILQLDNDVSVHLPSDYLTQTHTETPTHNLFEIARRIQEGYESGTNWTLNIEMSTLENLTANQLNEICESILNKNQNGDDPCDWELVLH